MSPDPSAVPAPPAPADAPAVPDHLRHAQDLLADAMAFVHPAALRTVAGLGVADLLVDGPRSAAELADTLGVHPGPLYRVLRLLAGKGAFSQDAAGRFTLTEAGAPLRSDAPASVRAAITMVTDPTFWLPTGTLGHCVTEGTNAFEKTFGASFFDWFAKDEATAAVFHVGMAALSDSENPLVARAFPTLPPGATLVDVGGGHGGLLAELLRERTELYGVLYDRDHVLAGHRLDAVPELAGRWSTADGDFFASVPPGADAYVLKRILHDWDDEQSLTLLRNCRRALAPGGRVVVVDAVLPEDDTDHLGNTMDLLMMASLVGRERTRAEFETLFAAADLRLVSITPTGAMPSVLTAAAAD
ncbi:methyltransferase [Streptomyces sp. BI20]|uniref:methyltransferase n=1 Tax=Streptomyces sp. BI20 TaxID=3403460 RepID=UPI003C741A65